MHLVTCNALQTLGQILAQAAVTAAHSKDIVTATGNGLILINALIRDYARPDKLNVPAHYTNHAILAAHGKPQELTTTETA